ncbi:unnamed protein product [Rotaria sp. Silwood1]|nr:unnamed protein product [Rotaria sp. Silwood1]
MFQLEVLDLAKFENFLRSVIPQHALRFIEYFAPSLNMWKPIEQFEAVQTVSIESAVDPHVSIVPNVKEMVAKAKQKCDTPKDGLTPDESASIMLYSMEWEPRENSFYVILNNSLRAEDSEKIKPWELYIKLFVASLEKLPTISKTIYRGVKRDLRAQYPQGKIFAWPAFSSCTRSIHVLQSEQFLGKTGTRTLFNIDCSSGKDIQQHSFFPTEDEVLLIAARKFQVVSCLDSGNDLFIIQLKEVDPDTPLLGTSRGGNAAASSNSGEESTTARHDSSAAQHQDQSKIPFLSRVQLPSMSSNPLNFLR